MKQCIKKILVEIVCVVVRNLLSLWKKEMLKPKKQNA